MFKNELDVAETVLRHLVAEGVDHLIVADNLSADGTRELLDGLAAELPLTVVADDEIAFAQSRKMSRLARQAYDMGASWVLPFDADEVWYSDNGTIAEALAAVPERYDVVPAGGWDHIVSNWACSCPFAPCEHHPAGPFSPYRRQRIQQLAKVCFRAHPDAVIDMGNHDVSPRGARSPAGVLCYRHFQYRSLEQMTRKLRQGRAAYEASDVHPMHGTHWRSGGLKPDAELAGDWAALCGEEGLVYDPAPIRVSVA